MLIFGAPNLDYYVDSFHNEYNNECNKNIRFFCKNEGINLDYFKRLLFLVHKK
ncbi:hypothetical protein BD780_002870 [Clostridium tetanomorphum]|uniref:Uncharacterized protein n=1 Tax=Clostridium tetanomorphum TaxID=1553 RepID=A0A923E8X9_CLOTT|nr:hypothetical protein [Clostridium tetanomorphum]MBC2397296.1 hypothetical protein [Clostridium tetanomorphum]MBP1862514.1 hypothetical protein [Clostridium tetanomorphum]NRS85645.1 hypothetical protein [Clostridium tetanomorphum]NRZ96343.1 hypothetical protein [Clostridium tetanomorphum]SQC02626.1 Uncharacterised protein [Clostridium tetanomorphum]